MQTAAETNIVGAENMDTRSSSASIVNEELDLPKFVAFKSLLNKNYLRPDGTDNYLRFMDVDTISWGVKHEVQKAGGGLVHIRCCDSNKYWSWGLTDYKSTWIVAEADEPEEDKSTRGCTLIKPSQCTKDGVRVVNFKLMKEGKWCSIHGTDAGYLEAGSGDFNIIDWASIPPIAKEKMDLPTFVVFQSLSNKNYVRPGGVHRYMKSEAEDVERWGVKHEVQKANYADGLVHIKCCDSDKYWSWGHTKDTQKYIIAQAEEPGEDRRTSASTLIKPSCDTKDGVTIVTLEALCEGKWVRVGVDSGGYLRDSENERFIISNWESLKVNQQQKPPVGAKNTGTGASGASIGNEELDLPKFVAINSIMNKKYLSLDDSTYIQFNAANVKSLSIKHEVQKAKCEGDEVLVHIKCCETGKYWSWGGTANYTWVVAKATQPEEDRTLKTCTLIKPTHYIKDGVSVVNLQIMYQGTWWSIGGDGEGYLRDAGGEDFIVSDWETLQWGLAPAPSGAFVADSVTIKLCQANYLMWKQQMLMFLASEGLRGFVDGTIKPLNTGEEGTSKDEKQEQEPAGRSRIEREQESERQVVKGKLGWKEVNPPYMKWKRSDDLVRGWILATLTKDILQQVRSLKTAREVWMELTKKFTLNFQLSHFELIDSEDRKIGQMVSQYEELHEAVLKADWETATKFFEKNANAVWQPITSSFETALIIAVRSPKRNIFVKNLIARMILFQPTQGEMEGMVQEGRALLALKDISGATALHAAVDKGNIEAVMWLVGANPKLANNGDKHGTLPVHVAAGLGNREMVEFLLKDKTTILSEDESGLKLFHLLASSGLYDIALAFHELHPGLACMEPSPLVVIAQKHTSFPSGTSLNILQRLIYAGIPLKFEARANKSITNHPLKWDIENNPPESDTASQPQGSDRDFKKIFGAALSYARKKLNAMFWDAAEKL